MFGIRKREPEPETSDAALHRAMARGDESAIARLYERHGALVYRYSLGIAQDASIAEEVTQEVFLALLRQSGQFDPARAALSTWLCAMARNLTYKQLESHRRHQPIDADDAIDIESAQDDPAEEWDRKESVAAVQRGLQCLPPTLREVILLCEFEELTYEGAAQIIGVPVGTVRSRLHRAKARLAQLLRDHSLTPLKESKTC